MKRYRVTFSKSAENDLRRIWRYVAKNSSVAKADKFIEQITADCLELEVAPERGVTRIAAKPNVRTIGAAKERVTLIYRVGESVSILRIHYAGRDHGFA